MKIIIEGAGLIGGSIAKSLATNPKYEVFITDINQIEYPNITFLSEENAFDESFDIWVLAMPSHRFEVKERKYKHILDVWSHKTKLPKLENFIPCHPIAGSEKAGFENSSPEIFKDNVCLVFGDKHDIATKFWQDVGMRVHKYSLKDISKHDKFYYLTSWLLQLTAWDVTRKLLADGILEEVRDIPFFRLAFKPPSSLDVAIYEYREKFFKSKFFKQIKEAIQDCKTIQDAVKRIYTFVSDYDFPLGSGWFAMVNKNVPKKYQKYCEF